MHSRFSKYRKSIETTEQSNSIEFEVNKEKYKLFITNNSNKISFKLDDLSSHTEYSLEKAFDDLDTGGMGIRMIRNLATELRYEHVECRNVVTIVFSGQTAAGGE